MKVAVFFFALLASSAFAQITVIPPTNAALDFAYSLMNSQAESWATLDQKLAAETRTKPYSGIVFTQCDRVNAYFDHRSRKIIVCYELLVDQMAKAMGSGMPRDRGVLAVGGSLMFVILHEYGHALISGSRTPVLGREEDAADQVAAVLSRTRGLHRMIVPGLIDGLMKRDSNENVASDRMMQDEHSLTPQRRANVICWAAAGDIDLLRRAIYAGLLSEQRAERCSHEAARADRAVNALLRSL